MADKNASCPSYALVNVFGVCTALLRNYYAVSLRKTVVSSQGRDVLTGALLRPRGGQSDSNEYSLHGLVKQK